MLDVFGCSTLVILTGGSKKETYLEHVLYFSHILSVYQSMLRTVKILEFNLISTFLLDNNRTQSISFSESGSCDCKPDIHFGEISNLL